MENLIIETNARLREILDNLSTIKNEYTKKLNTNAKEIESQLKTVDKYREDFFIAKKKIEKMNNDIEGFEEDYKKLVERFQDDELANILVAANKEISAKIEERKRKILIDRQAMNSLVEKAEEVKAKLVKLTAEKKALEVCLEKIDDTVLFYDKSLTQIIEYSSNNEDNLCAYFDVKMDCRKDNKQEVNNIEKNEYRVIDDEEDEVIDPALLQEMFKFDFEDDEEDNTTEDNDDTEYEIEDEEDNDTIEEEAFVLHPVQVEENDDDLLIDESVFNFDVEDITTDTDEIEDEVEDEDEEEYEIEDDDDSFTDFVFEDERLNIDEIEDEDVEDEIEEDEDDVEDDDNKDFEYNEIVFEDIDFEDDLDLEKLINFTDDLEDEDDK